MRKRANFALYKQAGLELTDVNNYDLTKVEEKYVGRWLEWSEAMPGQTLRNKMRAGKNAATYLVRASNRGFVTFLNELRADSFDSMYAAFTRPNALERLAGAKPREGTLVEAKAIANYVNVATGRGKIGWGDKQATLTGLNAVFFAPRLVASRINLLAGQPLYQGNARTRTMIAAEYARFAMGVGVVIALAAAAKAAFGDDDDEDGLVTTDPRSTDFLRIRFGNTYIDPLAGLAQVTTFLARIGTGETVTSSGEVRSLRNQWRRTDLMDGLHELAPSIFDRPDYIEDRKFGQRSAGDVLGTFMRSKLNPATGAAVTLAFGEDYSGQPADPKKVARDLFIPLSFQDVGGIMTDNGTPAGAAIFTLSLLGMGVQYRNPEDRR